MIKPIRSLESLPVGAVITDKLYDELRYGDSVRAGWINEFGSAQAIQEAIENFVKENGEDSTQHAVIRMFNSWNVRQSLARVKEKTKGEELAWAMDIARAESRQRYVLNSARRRRANRRYL